ncbi:MAG: cobyrinic acid a,c-diamide synthase, partial [Actinomycetota bacterium]|nr:cobyrinic acid a,c-diamide synthase [Actinomycetota bacterium]
MVRIPRLVVAAPRSGGGKTTVATGLMAALRARGLEVSGHKVGPDYIDPGYHALATGRPGRNLDPRLQGEDLVRPLFLHGALAGRPADVAVVEGVMGLFDGALGQGGYASTAHLARLLDAPVLLVVDAASAGRSVAATVLGCLRYEEGLRIGGVVLNRVGSQRHAEETAGAVEELGVPVLGVLHRDPQVHVPSRHLGLVPAVERAGTASRTVERQAALVADGVDLQAVLALANSAPDLPGSVWDPSSPFEPAGPERMAGPDRTAGDGPPGSGRAPVVAVAAGPVFTFRYAETTELLL